MRTACGAALSGKVRYWLRRPSFDGRRTIEMDPSVRVVATIKDETVIDNILTHLGLPTAEGSSPSVCMQPLAPSHLMLVRCPASSRL